MYGMQVVDDGGQVALGNLLEQQARRLEALAERVDAARSRLPRQSDTVWRGPAARIYTGALERVTADFAAAQLHLRRAAVGSRHAAATLLGAHRG